MTPRMSGEPALELRDIRKEYALRRGLLERLTQKARIVAAVDGVSLAIPQGSIFGLVGESGSGKSTLAQIIVRLIEPTEGRLLYEGREVAAMPSAERRRLRSASAALSARRCAREGCAVVL
jgi:ABC-type oligopeptide transport system ATPase subunit